MRLYLKNGNILKIDENTKLELLSTDEFVSVIKRESKSVPAGHIVVSLKYILTSNGIKYEGEAIFNSNKGITNRIDNNSPYTVKLVNWKLSDDVDKYFEFDIERVKKNKELLSDDDKNDLLARVNNINNKINADDPISKLKLEYSDIFEDWEFLKNNNQNLEEFFIETEKNAIEELYAAKDKVTVYGIKLSQFLDKDNLTCNNEIIRLLINYFGNSSIYERSFGLRDDMPCQKFTLDNVTFFRAVLVINIFSILEHINTKSLPLNVDISFEEKVYAEMLGPLLKTFLPKLFSNINDIKFYYKNDSLSKS